MALKESPRNRYNGHMGILRSRVGELCILLSALLWSLFPIVTILATSRLSPLYSAGISSTVATLFFATIVTIRGRWSDATAPGIWRDIILASLCMGVLFYGLYFIGLRHTSAGNAAILTLMEIFFSFLILGWFLGHEPLHMRNVLGGLSMFLGALLFLLPGRSTFHGGDLLILLATACAPLGNMFVKKARKTVSTAFILCCRCLIGSVFLFLLAAVFEPLPSAHALGSSLAFIAANGILIMGIHTILWVEAIHRIPITTAISLECIDPLFTLILAFFILHEQVQLVQIAGFVPIVIGIALLVRRGAEQSTTSFA